MRNWEIISSYGTILHTVRRADLPREQGEADRSESFHMGLVQANDWRVSTLRKVRIPEGRKLPHPALKQNWSRSVERLIIAW